MGAELSVTSYSQFRRAHTANFSIKAARNKRTGSSQRDFSHPAECQSGADSSFRFVALAKRTRFDSLDSSEEGESGVSGRGEQEKLQGEVVLKIVVSETGDVESAEVVSGHPLLAKAAVNAVNKWKLQPFIRNGKPRKVSTTLPFDFAFSDKLLVDNTLKAANAVPDAKSTSNAGPDAPKRIRVSSGVTQGLVLRKVAPVYPDDARRARGQGTVILQAVISKEGTIKDLHVVSGGIRC